MSPAIDLRASAIDLLRGALTFDEDGDVETINPGHARYALEQARLCGVEPRALLESFRWLGVPLELLSLVLDGEALKQEAARYALWCARQCRHEVVETHREQVALLLNLTVDYVNGCGGVDGAQEALWDLTWNGPFGEAAVSAENAAGAALELLQWSTMTGEASRRVSDAACYAVWAIGPGFLWTNEGFAPIHAGLIDRVCRAGGWA